MALLFFAAGVYCLATGRYRVLLFPDRIEVRGAIVTRRLTRSQILGWTTLPNGNGLALVPRDKALPTLEIATGTIKMDDTLHDWLHEFPRIEQPEGEPAEGQHQDGAKPGMAPEGRRAAIAEWDRSARRINSVGLIVGIWCLVYPRPYEMAIVLTAALPPVALALIFRWKGTVWVDEYKNDPHPAVGAALIFPALVLALRALTDFNVVRWTDALWLTVAPAIVIGWAAWRADPALRRRRGSYAFLVLLGAAYAYGAGLEANCLLDRSMPVNYDATVSEKRVVHRRTTAYELRLNPWASRRDGGSIFVSPQIFGVIQPNDIVTLQLRRGALGVPWYQVYSFRKRGS